MSGEFGTATSVTPAGPGLWSATIDAGWDIAGNANGGYLLAIAGRALSGATNRPDPVTITGHYLTPGRPGPVTVRTQVVKEGSRFATGTATLVSDGRPVVTVLGTFGDLSDAAGGPEIVDGAPPQLPPPDDCVPIEATRTFAPPFAGKVEMRIHPDDALFATGGSSGRPLMRGWFRLRNEEPIDSIALLCAVDAFPPTAFNARLPIAWTPTMELTAHVRARPAPGWLRCRFATRFVTGGFLEEDGEAWDVSDRLVAQSRQLALVPRR